MRRYSLLAAFVLGMSAIAVATAQGPGQGGAVVKQPWDTTPSSVPGFAQPPMSGMPTNLPAFAQPGLGVNNPSAPSNGPLFPQPEGPDPNADIAVQPSYGPWMVLVHWYTGDDAPKMARDFVMELRNTHKLQAYVFNKGADERRKEQERVKDIVQKQQKFREDHPEMIHVPGRVGYMRHPDQCAILIGGYKDEDAAKKGLEKIKKMPPPDPRKVKLAIGHFESPDPKTKEVKAGVFTINPFQKAMLVHNPTIKQERPDDWDKVDINLLKKLNRDEPFSLLECKKPFTLAIKQFHTPTTVQPKSASGKFLETLGLSKSSEHVDTAAHNAHNMADLMRKQKLDAFVLHTKFASIVTVGGYDDPQDQALKSMQRHLVETMRLPVTPMPMPMQVPR